MIIQGLDADADVTNNVKSQKRRYGASITCFWGKTKIPSKYLASSLTYIKNFTNLSGFSATYAKVTQSWTALSQMKLFEIAQCKELKQIYRIKKLLLLFVC